MEKWWKFLPKRARKGNIYVDDMAQYSSRICPGIAVIEFWFLPKLTFLRSWQQKLTEQRDVLKYQIETDLFMDITSFKTCNISIRSQ